MNKLRQIRELKGLNQRQLSELSHTPQALVSAIELGKLRPWVAVSRRLTKALGVKVEDLFPANSDTQQITEKEIGRKMNE